MATKPMEVRMKEVCTKCRPVSLGVKKEVREYERVVEWEEEKVYRVGDEGGRDEKKGGVELDFESEGREPKVEEEKSKGREEYNKIVFASLKEVEIGKDAEGNAVVKPKEVKEFQEVQLWETVKEWPAPARVVQGSVDIAQVAYHTSSVPQPPIARPIFGSFANLFIASGKQEKGETEDEDDEPFEIWTVVDEDPDWDKIDTEDAKRGMLWKNSGDWVNVNVQ
ncbi:uncharacterized protein PAC_16135 [Phialocephala subalpina]|uniref:Uncharacterized protein n=1 Tax=Phialocephala subalpina TaxID=576137 RepID=A0A1L7XMI9_9HELO|nr:uncharacterized protein PAC_16135 [Phialocephala subalpina]